MGSIGWATTNTCRDELRRHLTESYGARLLHLSIQPTGDWPYGEWSTVAYGAVKGDDGQVWALVAAAAKHNGEFYVKEMDETMGPRQYARVPLSLLDKLTEPANTHAAEWRTLARDWHTAEAAAKKAAAEAVGHRIRLKTPLNYSCGPVTEVEVRSLTLWAGEGQLLTPPNGWGRIPFEVLD